MKIALILGTRPEIIKMSPLVRACEKHAIDYFILHTGQHYNYEMDQQFFDELELPKPRYNLNIGSKPYHEQIARMIQKISPILIKEKPTAVIVQGDTITVLAGALAANKLGITVVHHEAGLRSYDLKMMEEINRTLTDHISDYLCAPTKESVTHLRQEGIASKKIFLSGNTIVDAVMQHVQLADTKATILKNLKLDQRKYIIVTAHRAENVDDRERLQKILQGLELVAAATKLPIICPIHPRTQKNINQFKLTFPKGVTIVAALGYLDFLQLEAHAALIITDSGGIQEEACILHVPCVTIRDTTERPETIRTGMNMLAGVEPKKIQQAAQKMLTYKKTKWTNPFGRGHAGEKIIQHLKKVLPL